MKRYYISDYWECHMEEHKYGEWVKWEDVEKLKKEKEWLLEHYAIEVRLAGESLNEAEEVIIKDLQQALKEKKK